MLNDAMSIQRAIPLSHWERAQGEGNGVGSQSGAEAKRALRSFESLRTRPLASGRDYTPNGVTRS